MKYKLSLYFLLIALIANGQKVFLNKHYNKPDKIDQIVFTPYFIDNVANTKINDVFCEIFGKGFEIADTSRIIRSIMNNYKFNKIIGNTAYRNYEIKELKRYPNLYSNLSPEEIEIYKRETLNSDILIVSSKIKGREVTKLGGKGNVTVTGNITVFDLRTGEFIIYISEKVKTKFEGSSYNENILIELLFEDLYTVLIEKLK